MKKKLLWLCLLLAAVLTLWACNGEEPETTAPEEPLPELYYNLDYTTYSLEKNDRPKDDSGLYRLRFACGGEVLELTCKDEKLVRYIDSMPVLSLETDDAGAITSAHSPDTYYTELCSQAFVRNLDGDQLNLNSSLAMSGIQHNIKLTENTQIFNVTNGTVTTLAATDLSHLDRVTIYGDASDTASYVFVDFQFMQSRLYWRTERCYDSKAHETTRIPDENGVYSLDFYCNGNTETLRCKDKALVNAIDAADSDNPYFGFTFDSENYINGIQNAAASIQGVLACVAHDVTELSGNSVKAVNLLSGKNETWTGTLAEDCRVYDVSKAAYADDRMGQAVDGIQLGDRVTVFTDTQNRAIQIYVTNRLVDVPIYFSTSRKYSSSTGETTREPDAEGWYTVSLIKEGDNKAETYKTRDKDLMTYLDSAGSRCLGIVADENNVLQRVYHPECLFGRSSWSNNGVVADTAGYIVTRMIYGNAKNVTYAVMMPDCKIYNVSTTGQYGAETKLQKGDYIYAFRQPTGELVHIYVVRRCLGTDTLYYNLSPRYDSETKETTRTPDAQGFYSFTLAHNGQRVTLKTDNKDLATALDSQSSGAASLLVEDGIILEVNAPNYACGGSQVSHGDKYVGLNQKGRHVTVNSDGKETNFAMASDCAIYSVKGGSVKTLDTIPTDAVITVYTNQNGEAQVIFVRG